MKRRLSDFFNNLSDAELIERNKKAAAARNALIMRVSLVCACVVFVLCIAGSFLFADLAYMRVPYLIITVGSAALYIVVRFTGERSNSALIYVVFAILVSYSIITSAFVSPNYICVTILVFLFQFPILYLDKSIRINLAVALAAAAYLLVVCQFKDRFLLTDEIVNVISFAIVGCFVGTFTRSAQLKNYDLQDSLRMSEEQYRLVLEHSGSIMCRYNIAERSISLSSEAAAVFAVSETVRDVPYGPVKDGRIAPESVDAYIEFYEGILRGRKTGTASFRCKTANGWHWLRGSHTTVFSDIGEPAYAVISFVDITEHREMELAYEKWKLEVAAMPIEQTSLFEWNLTSDSSEGTSGTLIDCFDNLTIDTFNARTELYAGTKVHPEDRLRYIALLNRERLLESYRQGENRCGSDYRELLDDSGGYRWMHVAVQLVPYPDSGEIKAFLIIHDIDAERRRSIAIEMQARADALTSLLNRSSFEDEASALLRSGAGEMSHAFVMIDIDGFKKVNDTFGHVAGDGFLTEAAHSLQAMLRQDDIVGRIGGDEFVVCMKNLSNINIVEKRARVICTALSRDLGGDVKVSGSLGIALFPRDGLSFPELYRKADIALYEAKKRGGNCYVFYSGEMESSAYVTNATPIDTDDLKGDE